MTTLTPASILKSDPYTNFVARWRTCPSCLNTKRERPKCETCSGKGRVDVRCIECRGSGDQIMVLRIAGTDMFFPATDLDECGHCEGTGICQASPPVDLVTFKDQHGEATHRGFFGEAQEEAMGWLGEGVTGYVTSFPSEGDAVAWCSGLPMKRCGQ